MRRLLLRSSAFVRAARRLLKKHPEAGPELQATLDSLAEDAFQPALRTHKLNPDCAQVQPLGRKSLRGLELAKLVIVRTLKNRKPLANSYLRRACPACAQSGLKVNWPDHGRAVSLTTCESSSNSSSMKVLKPFS